MWGTFIFLGSSRSPLFCCQKGLSFCRERPFFKINLDVFTIASRIQLVEAGGIEPPSDMGRPWRRYRLSFLLIVVREAAENGPSLSKTSDLFHFGKVRREAEHPPEMTSPAGRQRNPSFDVAGLSRQCVVIVDVYRLARMFNEDYGHNSACSSRSSACRRNLSPPQKALFKNLKHLELL